ncbi:MAG: deoxyguanosinetriphosphate triphosphohydrolase [Cyanobacteria bacterium SIG30]|nr:deoxyguanosinetriphosphate triphosphohydrolase [Cyanobacteria bacterium SIG30]
MENKFPEIKEVLHEKESQLSPLAAKSYESKGRKIEEEPCPFRTDFERDRDRILHSKAFRRLKRKTQVFYAPKNDHLRTRLTHTLEVSQIARTIARILNLNEDLTEAIALGHDLGHTPFGHTGEEALNSVCTNGFKHNEHSVRVIEVIEKLNLCEETLDGILNHTGKIKPMTLEGQIVKIADRVAYINHDIDDAIRENVMQTSDIPIEFRQYFGETKHDILTKIITDIYENSVNKNEITMSETCVNFLNNLRAWMFKNVYFSDKTKSDEQKIKKKVIRLFEYYKNLENEQSAIDYVAGMSDEFAKSEYKKIFKK